MRRVWALLACLTAAGSAAPDAAPPVRASSARPVRSSVDGDIIRRVLGSPVNRPVVQATITPPAPSLPIFPVDSARRRWPESPPQKISQEIREETRLRRPKSTKRATTGGASLAKIKACESGGNYSARSASGKYSGAFQFDAATHRSVGGDGYAGDDSPAEQDAAAARLYARRGGSPWPVCSRR